MTTPEPAWTEFEDAPARNSALESGLLEMRGRVHAVRVTHFPGIALPHIELWTERHDIAGCDPDGLAPHNYFSAFAPIRQDQTDAEWLEVLRNSVSTLLVPGNDGLLRAITIIDQMPQRFSGERYGSNLHWYNGYEQAVQDCKDTIQEAIDGPTEESP